MRACLLSFSVSGIILLAAACKPSQPPVSPLMDEVPPAIIESRPTATPIKRLLTESPAAVPTATQIQVTLAPSSAPPPTTTVSAILSTSTIMELEQIDMVEYAPWDLVLAVTWSPESDLIAVSAGESIYLYTTDLEERGRLVVGDWTTSLAFHPQGAWLASGGRDGQLRIWDIDQQRLVLLLEAHKKGVNAVAYSPDGRFLATAGNDAVARLWDPGTGENLAQMIGGTYAVPSIAFNRDGTDLAITNGGLIRIRNVESGRFVQTLRSDDTNYSISRSADGDLLAAGSTAGNIFLWDLSSGDSPDALTLPYEPGIAPSSLIWSVDFSPDSTLLAASDNHGTIRFWDVIEGKFLVSRSVIPRAITSLAFSPDGRYLVTGGLDGILRLWATR